MRVWRICREAFAGNPIDGRGGLISSARWHSRGRRILYTSQSLSLAALEMLVHVDPGELPNDLVRVEIVVPTDISVREIDAHTLPADWQAVPAPEALQTLGDDWLTRCETALLRVPSAVVPDEHNYLINPDHADFGRIKVADRQPFTYDPRLRRSRETR